MRIFNWVAVFAMLVAFGSMLLALLHGEGRLFLAHLNAFVWAGVAAIPVSGGGND